MRSLFVLPFVVGSLSSIALAGQPRACVSAGQAAQMVKKDVCIAAHVYNVVELPDGTRYLDICAPDTPDENCRFTILSLNEDRDTVGGLGKYRDTDIQMRGTVQPMHGRAGIVLSHARQFEGGPPKFRPNPRLARGFSAEQSRPAIADPSLRPQGRARSFMNRLDQERLPAR